MNQEKKVLIDRIKKAQNEKELLLARYRELNNILEQKQRSQEQEHIRSIHQFLQQ